MRNFLKLLSRLWLILGIIILTPCCSDVEFETHPVNGTSTAIFNPNKNYGTLIDQDGNIYKTITIGTQTWMAENLRTTIYRNGNPIPEVINRSDWETTNSAAYSNPNNTTNVDSITTFGRLYNWFAISNSTNIAPKGWHVSTMDDWITLANYIGNDAGNKMKEIGFTHWVSPNAFATNETGFTALPGILRLYDGTFSLTYANKDAYWWTSTDFSIQTAIIICILDNLSTLSTGGIANKHHGFYIRCVKD
jgi:uncharacterized protein (TIGR02145 family)